MTVDPKALAAKILARMKAREQPRAATVQRQTVPRQAQAAPRQQKPRVDPKALAQKIKARMKGTGGRGQGAAGQTAARQQVPQACPQSHPQAQQTIRASSSAGPAPYSLLSTPDLQVAEAFTGGGLFTLALVIEGIPVQQVCELDPHAVASLQENLLSDARVCDALTWEPTVPEGGLDLLVGGPPCQPWSKGGLLLGKDDPRNMYPRVVAWIRKTRPRIVCLENSDEIVKKKEFIDYFRDHFWSPLRELGYEGTVWACNAADYGTPQHRLRAFVVAWPRGSSVATTLLSPPPATHARPGSQHVRKSSSAGPATPYSPLPSGGLRPTFGRDGDWASPISYPLPPTPLPWVRAFDRLASGCCGGYGLYDCKNLGNLDRRCETCVMGGDLPANYEPLPDAERTRLTGANRELLAREKHGRPRVFSFPPTDVGGAEAWRELSLDDARVTLHLAPTVIANLKRGMPYGVITTDASPSRDAVDRNDPASVRRYTESLARISVRDAAKLQDVPQWYVFSGSHRNAFEQIGNGIPVNLGRAVARHLLHALGRETPVPGSLAAEPYNGLWPIDRLDVCGGFTGISGYPGTWQPPSPQKPFDPLARPLASRPQWQRAIGQGKRAKRGVARWQDRDGDGYPQAYVPDPSWRPSSPHDHPEGFIDFNEFYGWVQGEDDEVYDHYAELYGWG